MFSELKNLEVFENLVFEGTRRYYIEDLSQRDYSLENTTPYKLDLFGNIVVQSSWGNLLCEVIKILLERFPHYKETLIDFRCQWTKTAMFTVEEKTNYKNIAPNLYINCNHTALHSCWFLQDILDYFKIEKSNIFFLIHRPCSAEPLKTRDYIEKIVVNEFSEYLKNCSGKPLESREIIIYHVKNHLNPMLSTISKSYNNFFLFDDSTILMNYIIKVRKIINLRYSETSKQTFRKILELLVDFYKLCYFPKLA